MILLIFLILRFFGNFRVYTMGSRSSRYNDEVTPEPTHQPQPQAKPTKIIAKDEGEYVDYEELKD